MTLDLLTFSMRSTPPKAGADWFKIVAKKGEAAKVYIYDEIGFWGTNAKDFAAQLSELDTDEIELHLNSPGGSVFDGLAIMAALKDHKAKVVAKVDGMAASAASFILQAADERLITRNAQIMIHDAKAYAGGNAGQMRKAADLLDRVSDNIADIYAVRSGQGTVESWRAIMVAGDEWYSGNEALDAGLVDAVVDNPEEDGDAPEEASNSWNITEIENFLKTPTEKLAANANQLTIKNRVEEAHMTGPNPKSTPPAAPQPPAPAAPQAAAPAPAVPPVAPEANVTFMVNGAEMSDMAAVQAHITGLETFKKEAIDAARTSFVAELVKDNKIMADAQTVEATEAFALSLSGEQFTAWKQTMESAPSNGLFAKHGTSANTQAAPLAGPKVDNSIELATAQEIVDGHRAAGMPEEVLKTKASYLRLQELLSAQAGK